MYPFRNRHCTDRAVCPARVAPLRHSYPRRDVFIPRPGPPPLRHRARRPLRRLSRHERAGIAERARESERVQSRCGIGLAPTRGDHPR